MKKLILTVYYLGIAECGISNAKAIENELRTPSFWLMAACTAFLSGLGGGMVRDLLLLKTYPVAFTMECVPEVCILEVISVLVLSHLSRKKRHDTLLSVIDDMATPVYLIFGVQRGLAMNATSIICVLCGFITAVGGGILAALLRGESINKVLRSNVCSRVMIILASFLYYLMVMNEIDDEFLDRYNICFIGFTYLSMRIAHLHITDKIAKVIIKSYSIGSNSETVKRQIPYYTMTARCTWVTFDYIEAKLTSVKTYVLHSRRVTIKINFNRLLLFT